MAAEAELQSIPEFEQNPAERLIRLLTEATKVSQNKEVLAAWAEVFKVEAQPLLVMRKIALLDDVKKDVERQIKAFPNIETKTFLEPLRELSDLYNNVRQFSEPWGNRGASAASVIRSLEYCASILRSHPVPVRAIPENELASLRDTISALFDDVNQAKLSPKLKVLLLDLIEALRTAISEYQIGGVKRLRQELASVIEKLQRSRIWEDVTNPSKDDSRVTKVFWSVISRVDVLSSTAVNSAQLLPMFAPAIEETRKALGF